MSDEGILDICHLMQLIPVEEIYFYLTTLSIESTNFMSLFPFISTFTSTQHSAAILEKIEIHANISIKKGRLNPADTADNFAVKTLLSKTLGMIKFI